MKTLVLCLVLVVSLAHATPFASTDREIDEMALVGFSMLRAQIHDGDLRRRTVPMLPILMQNTSLTWEQKMYLLTSNGFDQHFAEDIILQIMPVLKAEGKSTHETIMTLLFISKTICKNSSECSENIDLLMPLLRGSSVKGCNGSAMTAWGNVTREDEMCVCDEQTDAIFWINMYEQLAQTHHRRNTSIPDQFPVAITMLLNQLKCDGHLKYGKSYCACSAITKGTDATYLQYIITSEEIQKKLTPQTKLALRESLGGNPKQRITGLFNSGNLNVDDYFLSLLAPGLNPTLLSLLSNQGATGSDAIQQLILSSIGLDTSLLHIILNNGLSDGLDRTSLIRYLTNLGVLDASILPLILGVPNSQHFFISSLVEAGQIDPTTAILLLGQQSGASNEDTISLLITAISNQNNPDYVSSIGRPYIPPLPEGVFPGSQLFFAHFESLGVNTCALHDLRNRFECGYIGISAEECETVPYCCYSPIFLTDEEVRAATNTSITAASAIPWCYYNIFFIYYREFYLPILRPGQFASPIQCSGLFRYGLQLDPSLISLIDTTGSSTFSNLIIAREECGFPGITEFQCVAVRGCCWDGNAPFRVPQCYRQNGAQGIAFDYNNVPAAYRPVDGSCNVNPYQIPVLYYQRVACHYTLEFHNIGYNLLSFPSRLDCLTKLGCCWEDDDSVIEQYPFTPRCYQRVGGVSRPSIIPGIGDLILRSGDSNDLFPGFPKVQPPNTK